MPGKLAQPGVSKFPQASSCFTIDVSTIYLLVVVSCCTADSQSSVTCVTPSCVGLLRLGLMISMLLVVVMMLCYCGVRVSCDEGVSLWSWGGFVGSASLNEMTQTGKQILMYTHAQVLDGL